MKLLAYALIWLVLAVLLGQFIAFWASHFLGITSPGLLLAIKFSPVLPAYLLLPNRPPAPQLPSPSAWTNGFGLGLALIFTIAGICDLLGLATLNYWILFTPVGLGLFFGRIVQAGAEEFVFRNFLYQKLSTTYPHNVPFHHIGAVGAVFVLTHALNPGFSLHSAVTIFLFSALMCKQFDKNGLGWVWGFHTAWNWGLLIVVDSGAVFWLLQSASLLAWYQFKGVSWKTLDTTPQKGI
jgi:membrane protease YdiL (CAAX protease family)